MVCSIRLHRTRLTGFGMIGRFALGLGTENGRNYISAVADEFKLRSFAFETIITDRRSIGLAVTQMQVLPCGASFLARFNSVVSFEMQGHQVFSLGMLSVSLQ